MHLRFNSCCGRGCWSTYVMYPPTPNSHVLKAALEGYSSQHFWPAVHLESVGFGGTGRPQARRLRHGYLEVKPKGPGMVSVKGTYAGHRHHLLQLKHQLLCAATPGPQDQFHLLTGCHVQSSCPQALQTRVPSANGRAGHLSVEGRVLTSRAQRRCLGLCSSRWRRRAVCRDAARAHLELTPMSSTAAPALGGESPAPPPARMSPMKQPRPQPSRENLCSRARAPTSPFIRE
nr:uncharacterized protein LOC116158354 [Camelus dromedarius]